MKNKLKIKNIFNASSVLLTSIFMALVFMYSCDPSISGFEYNLPEANSKADLTPPTASFSASVTDDYLTYTFANGSTSATDYLWDFGDGNTSTSVDGTNTYPGEGTYTVTLTASDKLGATSTYSMEIEVVEPEVPQALLPEILEGGFEDLSLPDGTGDGRDSWRNDMGGVIQITSSPVYEGSKAAKFPSAGDRVAYQELTLSPNTDYILTYYYTLKTDNPGSLTVSILPGGGYTDLSTALSSAITSYQGTDQTDANAFTRVDINFNTGANDTVAILITNEGVEARADAFSLSLP